MANRDGTGPMNQGAMTGRGMGFCATTNAAYTPGYGLGCRRGMGMGRKMGRGLGRGFQNSPIQNLNAEKASLLKRIEEIDKQLS